MYMVIAVNTRFLLPGYLEGYGNFIVECFKRIAADHPSDSFIFLFDRPFENSFIFSDNIIPLIVTPVTRHPLLLWSWLNLKIPPILKKYKADVFVSLDGSCSLNTRIPQCLGIHDLAFIHYPAYLKRSHLLFYKKFTPLFIKKARRIVTVSQFSSQDIISSYGVDGDKIDVVYNGVSNKFLPIHFSIKAEIKEKYTDGNEYFLYTGAIHPRKNLINLLKAFSIFKKKQKSSMRLVIVGRLAWKNEKFMELLKSYRFKEEVSMPGYIDQVSLAKITAAAYAMVYPSLFEGFGVPPLEAMRCGVPVLASNVSAIPEIGGNAIMYFDPADYVDIANKMMMIYKDEKLRREYIELGLERVKLYNWERTSGLLWDSIIAST